MNADSYPYTSETGTSVRYWRWGLAVMLLLALVFCIWLALLLHDTEPNYYQPARAALVVARHRLNEYYSHESMIIQQLHKAHVELDATLSLLTKAENLDPLDKQRLDGLRLRLEAMDDVKLATQMRPDQLHDSYSAIAVQLDELIHRLELPKR